MGARARLWMIAVIGLWACGSDDSAGTSGGAGAGGAGVGGSGASGSLGGSGGVGGSGAGAGSGGDAGSGGSSGAAGLAGSSGSGGIAGSSGAGGASGSAGSSGSGGSGGDGPTLGSCDPADVSGPLFMVDPSAANASDSNVGSPAEPWASLKYAVSQLQPGDTLFVGEGTYTDPDATSSRGFNPASSGTAAAPITLRSCPHGAAVVVAPSMITVALGIYSNEHIVVDGFRVEGMLKAHGAALITFVNNEVVRGSTEGNDPSLNWGIAIHSSNDCIVRNNRIHSMADSGNQLHNAACVMVGFGAERNLVEFNEADASDGIVYSAFGQKGGQIFDNVWRRNIARNATTGFLGMGSTDGTRYASDNEFVENIVLDSDNAFELDHNCERFIIHNNTVVGAEKFFDGGYLPDATVLNTQNEVYNNIVYASTRGYHRGPSEVDFSVLLARSDYNLWSVDKLATWNWGGAAHETLADWQVATGFDTNSLDGDPLLDADFHLSAGSPALGAGDDTRDMGAFPTGTEQVGPTWP